MTKNLPQKAFPKFPKCGPSKWWNANRILAVYIVANPENKDKTKTELAEMFGKNRRTLFNYEMTPWFTDTIIKIRKQMLASDFPEVCNTISRFAKAGSAKHIDIFLDLIGESPQQKQEIEQKILVINISKDV